MMSSLRHIALIMVGFLFPNEVDYVIYHNRLEAEKDKRDREEIIEDLKEKIETRSLKRIVTGVAERFCKIQTKEIIIGQDKIQSEACL